MADFKFTCVGRTIDKALKGGYTIVSEQGSSRSGKTYNTVAYLITYLANNPDTRLSVVRATLPALKGSVLVDFKEIMLRFGLWDDRSFNKTENIYTFANGSVAEFFSCDNEQKLRGRKRDVLFVNEANELKFIEWQQLKMRTSRFAILDYNPSFSDEHWINQVNRETTCYHFITTYKDNEYLERTIVEEIESLQWKNKSLWQVYGLGMQSQVEGLVFPDIEIVDEVPQYTKREYIGMDFGYTNDPTAIVRVAVVDEDLYVEQLAYSTQMLTADIVRVLKGYPRHKVISESADPRLIQEIYRAGVNIFPVKKYAGSIMAGISRMHGYRLCVTRRSADIIKEFKNYTYQQDKEGRWLNEPIDTFNHAIDAIRYVCLSELNNNKNKGITIHY